MLCIIAGAGCHLTATFRRRLSGAGLCAGYLGTLIRLALLMEFLARLPPGSYSSFITTASFQLCRTNKPAKVLRDGSTPAGGFSLLSDQKILRTPDPITSQRNWQRHRILSLKIERALRRVNGCLLPSQLDVHVGDGGIGGRKLGWEFGGVNMESSGWSCCTNPNTGRKRPLRRSAGWEWSGSGLMPLESQSFQIPERYGG